MTHRALLCCLAALTALLQVQSRGVELLEELAACAQEVGAACGVDAGQAAFVHGDALSDSLADAGVLMLASQCWDEALRARAREKLEAEAPAGLVVVDYVPSLADSAVFELAGSTQGEVSWNDRQSFFAYRRR